MLAETKARSWAKSIVWRLFGFIILGIISFIFTGSWTESLLVSGWFNVLRFLLYYVHERLWLKVKWGII